MRKFCKVAVLILAAAMMFTACGSNNIPGGWQKAKSKTVTAELQDVFNMAAEPYGELDLAPEAYLASQVVAGTNHLFKCVDSAKNKYNVTVFQDLEGGYTITKVENKKGNDVTSDILPEISGLEGGNTVPADGTITAELQEIFNKALEGYDGVKLEPVELLSTQVVAGINYRFLCNETVLVPNAEPKEVIVTVFEDLDGSCSITDVTDK